MLRARCNQRLFFNNGTLFQRFRSCSRFVFDGASEIAENFIDQIHDAYNIMETILASSPFLVCDHLTVADICVSVTTEVLNQLVPIDEEVRPNVMAWLGRIKDEVPFYDEMNAQYVEEYSGIIKATMEKNASTD